MEPITHNQTAISALISSVEQLIFRDAVVRNPLSTPDVEFNLAYLERFLIESGLLQLDNRM